MGSTKGKARPFVGMQKHRPAQPAGVRIVASPCGQCGADNFDAAPVDRCRMCGSPTRKGFWEPAKDMVYGPTGWLET